MNISSRCDYACRAILELAINAPNDSPLTATTIAENRNIPEKYLVHILLQLKKAGILTSVRGAQGGYRLAQKAPDISLMDIVLAVDGPILNPAPCTDESSRELQSTWEGVTQRIESVLREITVQEIIDKANKSNMYFI
ncbi:Rrf2 family transcriptional regulator [bacterium AH-315-P07]|nr:Rrf2 family transcriptional regulator [bacterium AH-315-P07]